MFIKAGYRLHQTNDDNETVYDTIQNNDEMAAFLSPSLRKTTTGRLDSLAANAVLKHWIPHLGEASLIYSRTQSFLDPVNAQLCFSIHHHRVRKCVKSKNNCRSIVFILAGLNFCLPYTQ